MIEFDQFVKEIWKYFNDEIVFIKFQTPILIILSRLIFFLVFYYYWNSLQGRSLLNSKKFWLNYAALEFLICIFGVFNHFIPFLIASFSISFAGILLLRINTSDIFKILGYFLFPSISLISALVLIIISAFSGDDFWWESGSILLGVLFSLRKMREIEGISFKSEFLKKQWKSLWHSMPKYIKITIVILIFAIPTTAYGFIYTNIISYKQTIMLPMEDGTKLHTQVFFPPQWDGNPKPVIFLRTPYNIESQEGRVLDYTTNKGYITVFQDSRGRWGSQGTYYVFHDEANDGLFTANWILDQKWCNGNIATIGASAECMTQSCLHAEAEDQIKAAVLYSGASDLYDHWEYPGGCLRKWFMEVWLGMIENMDYYPTIIENAMKDDYWTDVSIKMDNRYEDINVRAVHWGGWYDCFQQGTIDSFTYYNKYGTDYAKDHQIMVMGPWGHGLIDHPNVSYPQDFLYQGFSIEKDAEEFIFQDTLWENTQNWSTQPRIYYSVMGDPASTDPKVNQWRTAMEWPIPGALNEPWYFHPDGNLNNTVPNTASNQSFLYDPSNPVQNGGGTTFVLNMGAYDNQIIESGRTDILKFTTPVLENPVEIVGKINATLNIKSNCTDTDFTVKLLDIFPDGREIWVADGILKTRYRNGFSSSQMELMTPDTIYELEIDMWSMAYRFVPGHQIRVSVSSSNYPKYAVNPNTGGDVQSELPEEYNIANNTILLGQGSTPSCIWFPRTE